MAELAERSMFMNRTNGSKRSEKVSRMIDNFMELHNEGYTIPEIAKKFNLSETCVRNHLQEIADNNGVSRESLLQIVHSQHFMSKVRNSTQLEKEDPKELRKAFESAMNEVTALIRIVDNRLEGER